MAIGDFVLNLRAVADSRLLDELESDVVTACKDESLNHLMALGRKASSSLRARVTDLLCDRAAQSGTEPHLLPQFEGGVIAGLMGRPLKAAWCDQRLLRGHQFPTCFTTPSLLWRRQWKRYS